MLSMPASFPKFQDPSTRSGAGSGGPEPIFTLPFSAREAQAASKQAASRQAAIPDPKMGKGEIAKEGSEGVNAWRKHGGPPPWRTCEDYWSNPQHPLFLKLIQDPSVKEILITRPDGTYDYTRDPRLPFNSTQTRAAAIIRAQNGTRDGGHPDMSRCFCLLTEGDIVLFHKLTGYYLLDSSGGAFISNDEGKDMAPEDRDRVLAMFRVFHGAAGRRDEGGGSYQDLTLHDLKEATENLLPNTSMPGESFEIKILRSLLDLIDKAIDKEKQDLKAAKDHAAQNSAAQSLSLLTSTQRPASYCR